jgi:hypothetical protein
MDDFENHEVLLAFTHRGRQIQLRANAKGWAQMYLRENDANRLADFQLLRCRKGDDPAHEVGCARIINAAPAGRTGAMDPRREPASVRFLQKSGRDMLTLSLSVDDPKQTSGQVLS